MLFSAHWETPFRSSGSSRNQVKEGEVEQAVAYNEFNFWRPPLEAEQSGDPVAFETFNFWRVPPPTLEEIESATPVSPQRGLK